MSISLLALRQSLEVLLEQADGPAADVIRRAQAQLETLQAELARGDESARLAALYEVSHAIGSSLDLTEVLNQVMDAVIRLTGAERGFLMLFNADTGDLDFRSRSSFARRITPCATSPAGGWGSPSPNG